jgi:hypothetical protein
LIPEGGKKICTDRFPSKGFVIILDEIAERAEVGIGGVFGKLFISLGYFGEARED